MLRRATALKRICDRQRVQNATRIKDANGKLVAIYAKTPEELYNKETFALEQINLYCSRQRTIMYSVEVHNGLYDTKRGRRKMGRDTS